MCNGSWDGLQSEGARQTGANLTNLGRSGCHPPPASLASKHSRACNGVQGATARLALTALVAVWNLQITETKDSCRARIPPSPPTQAADTPAGRRLFALTI